MMNEQEVKEDLHTMIDQAFAKMDEMKTQAAQAMSDVRHRIKDDLQSLEVKKQELESRMADLRSAAADKRDELSEAVEESAQSFRESLERMASVFGKEPTVRK
ncbi:MAG: hypothetical protein J5I41_04490 [Saprospiraceae bacterium]|nr:hypothetical protein [Saprospiraceae bacterium]